MAENASPAGVHRAYAQVLVELLERAHSASPSGLPAVVRDTAALLGARQAQVWLVDFQQEVLLALDDTDPDAGPVPRRMPVHGTAAGLAYTRGAPMHAPAASHAVTLYVPLLDGIERLGVLELVLPRLDDELLAGCRRFTEMVTQFVATKGRVTDEFHRFRACEPMNLAAQMQWQLLPPLTAHTPEVTVAGQVEPAYEVGGDSFRLRPGR